MPTIKQSSKKKKPESKKRTRPRVESSEPKSTTAKKSAQHRQTAPPVMGEAANLGDGQTLVTVQLSELVPVAQYANITLGPIQISYKLSGVDWDILADIDWDSDDPLTDEQQKHYDRMRNSLRSTGKVIEHHIGDDRSLVEESVRFHNEREKAEEAARPKKRRSSR